MERKTYGTYLARLKDSGKIVTVEDIGWDANKFNYYCINGDDNKIYCETSLEILKKLDESKNRKNTIRLTESDLKRVISESVKKVLKETKVSLDDYDNPRIRYNRMDSDAPWEQDSGYNDGPTNDYYIDEGEARWNQLLKLRNDGILTDEELDAIRDRFGY